MSDSESASNERIDMLMLEKDPHEAKFSVNNETMRLPKKACNVNMNGEENTSGSDRHDGNRNIPPSLQDVPNLQSTSKYLPTERRAGEIVFRNMLTNDVARNQPSLGKAHDVENIISEEDSDNSSKESNYCLPPDPALWLPIINHAVALPTSKTNRITDKFDVLVQRRIPKLGVGDPMHLKVEKFPLGYVFRIETEHEHETVLVLDPMRFLHYQYRATRTSKI